jgi:group I intron endonuclease
MIGIYKIKNEITGDFYIGQTVDIKRRFTDHVGRLRRGIHSNRFLQNVFNKYGEKTLSFCVLLFCEKEELDRYEVGLIEKLSPRYNLDSGGNKQKSRSEYVKQRVSEANTGNKYCVGRVLSEETKRKISESHKGKTRSIESRMKQAASCTGKIHSKETKLKMSKSAIGIWKNRLEKYNGN